MESESGQPCKRRCTEKDKYPPILNTANDEGNSSIADEDVGSTEGNPYIAEQYEGNTEANPYIDEETDKGNPDRTDQLSEEELGLHPNADCDGQDTGQKSPVIGGAEGHGIHGDEDSRSSSCSSNDLHCSATDILVDWVKSQKISKISSPHSPSEKMDSNFENRPSCSYSSESPHIVVEDTGEVIPVENLNADSSDSDCSDTQSEVTRPPISEKPGSTFRIHPNRHTEMTLTFGGTSSRSNMTHTVLLGDGCNRRESVQYVFNFRSTSDTATQTEVSTPETVIESESDKQTLPSSDITCPPDTADELIPLEMGQNINNLPSNILIQIFKSLSMYDLLCRASLVCKTWHTLSHDPDLWRTVDLSHQHKANDEVLSRLTSFSDRVTSINVEDTKFLTTYGISLVCVKCRHLQKLKLTRCFSVENNVLMMVGNSCRNLQCLYLDGCYRISDQWTNNVGDGCPSLRELVLSRCSQMTDVGIGKIAQSCHNLQNIILDHCNKVTDYAVEMLADFCPNLLTLSLANCNITDTGICSIYRMKNLEYLDISNLPGGSFTPRVVSQLTRYCDKLECLNVSLNLLNDQCIQDIMRHGQRLKKLFCVSCSISDEGLRGIAVHGRNIEKLDLGWCKDITDKGIWDLTENCPSLKYLGLIRCDAVTEKGVEDMVEKYPNIQFSTFFMESRKLIQKAIANGFKFVAESEKK